MQSWQASAAWWCTWLIIQLGKHPQGSVSHTHKAVAVAGDVPFAIFGFDAADCTYAIVGVTGIHGSRGKQVGEVIKSGLILRWPIEVDAVFGVMVYLGKQL